MLARVRAACVVCLLYVLHQDFWWWTDARPILFGIFPVGLSYHVAYTLVTVVVLWWLVGRFWPANLDTDIITRTASGTMVGGFLPVVPMTVISALLMVVVSRLTADATPGGPTLARYFSSTTEPALGPAHSVRSRS